MANLVKLDVIVRSTYVRASSTKPDTVRHDGKDGYEEGKRIAVVSKWDWSK